MREPGASSYAILLVRPCPIALSSYPRRRPWRSVRRASALRKSAGMTRNRPPGRLRPVKEYDLFVPLFYNDGEPVEQRKIEGIGEQLLKQFTGLTFFPQANQGYWMMGDVTYRDQVVIFRVLTDKAR